MASCRPSCRPSTKRKREKELPEDLIRDEILTRLPPKFLVRFRCVSKSWNSLVFEPQFVKSHLTRQYCNLLTYKDYLENYKIRIVSRTVETGIHAEPLIGSKLIGSINGLVLFVSQEKISLWNPAIRQYKEIFTITSRLCTQHVYGFWWDQVENDYKVVMLWFLPDNSKQGSVYSSKSDSWTQLTTLPIFGVRSPTDSINTIPSTFVKGCPYWSYTKYLPWNDEVNGSRYMGVFKFVTEKNEFRLLPDFDCALTGGCKLNLAKFKDSPVAIAYKSETKILDIYSLDKEESDGVWSKMYILGPLNFGMKGETLFPWLGKVVFCCESKTNEKNVADIQGFMTEGRCFRYMPSLVSVPGMKLMMHLEN